MNTIFTERVLASLCMSSLQMTERQSAYTALIATAARDLSQFEDCVAFLKTQEPHTVRRMLEEAGHDLDTVAQS